MVGVVKSGSGSVNQFTNYAQLAMVNWALTTAPMTGLNTRPTAWFMGLSSTIPTNSGGGITEPIGNNYARQSITFGPSIGNPGLSSNINLIQFTASGGNWGSILYALVFDGVTLGHCWAIGPLDSPRTIQNGDTLQFQQGTLAVGIN
jgi:hypothetical protein